MSGAMELPKPRLTLGITGHRDTNSAFQKNELQIRKTLSGIFDIIERETRDAGTTRVHSLLAQGTDLLVAELALERGWDISAPLPFGLDLNTAINAHPENLFDAKALLEGRIPRSKAVAERAARINELESYANLFELAEQDETISNLYLQSIEAPENKQKTDAYVAVASDRAAVAGKVMIEHSAIMLAVWDGVTRGSIGGTRHSMLTALQHGTPVIWIDATAPDNWCLLTAPESLATLAAIDRTDRTDDLRGYIGSAIAPPVSDAGSEGLKMLQREKWHKRSNPLFHSYRRVEALFGGQDGEKRLRNLSQQYETPQDIAKGSSANLLGSIRALPDENALLTAQIEKQVIGRFAWADGLSTHLSDAYRGSMAINFFLAAFAVIGGIAYLPLGAFAVKWPFALFELVLLLIIIALTTIGRKKRWHSRWFETRRVAEYLRHAPILLVLGVARAPWRWPKGANTSWPERYARSVLQDIGLPQLRITRQYLRHVLDEILLVHIKAQHGYHTAKAKRLASTHHNLDRMSEGCFVLAVIAVSCFLTIAGLAAIGILPDTIVYVVAKPFTFLGVMFPSLGGLFAGIRFFGDFERFAAISEVTAAKLGAIQARVETILNAPDEALQFSYISDLAHEMDKIVLDEIENWQAVFSAKQISVPV